MAVPVILARVGWTALGIVIGAVAKTQFGKDATDMFKDGVKEMAELHKKDAATSQRQHRYDNDLASKRQLVKDIREGRQR